MFNLVQLFLRLSGFFVFLLLEIICFTMVVKYNQTQQGIYVNSINRGTGFLQKIGANTSYYLSLDDENYRLSRANARLLEKLYNEGIDTTSVDSTFQQNDTMQFDIQIARIINNTVNNHHNYLTLDKGTDDGASAHLGLITEDGVVGIIRKVSKRYSVAMSMLHRQMRVSAKVKGTHYPGSLIWNEDEKSTRLFTLLEVPKHAEVAEGDTVITSGFSSIFPEGVMLGTIEKINLKPGSHAFEISVKSKVDMTNLQYVYIVKNLFKKEQQELETAVVNEDE
ncbi:MAG: rod shape-determining protein MreC [Bacteroidota bacterium]